MKTHKELQKELEDKRQSICNDIVELDKMLSDAYPDKHTYLEVDVDYRVYRTLDSARGCLSLSNVDINFKIEY